MVETFGELDLFPVGIDVGIVIGGIVGSKRVRNIDINAPDSVDEVTESLKVDGEPVFDVEAGHCRDFLYGSGTATNGIRPIIRAVCIGIVNLVILT